ncbi:MAG: ArsR/SmtB family transcription factor [Solirubrobacteraceae bacterium]
MSNADSPSPPSRAARAKSARATRSESLPIDRVKAEFFQLLSHPARVRILELLRAGERTVGDLQAALGLDSSGTSQHLGAMRRQGLLDTRRAGTSVYYRVADPRVFELLEVAKEILTKQLRDASALLDDLASA